ncbi:MAG: hypothetical protein EAZ98_10035 [Oscillatoriales cyanobacterium]|nr:MAG: hypothetical protein EAZ98_10035 [Oscillatoriales cyanobacterium]
MCSCRQAAINQFIRLTQKTGFLPKIVDFFDKYSRRVSTPRFSQRSRRATTRGFWSPRRLGLNLVKFLGGAGF